MRASIGWSILLATCLLPVGLSANATAKQSDVVAGIAGRMTDEALAAGAVGDAVMREQLLERVMTIAPNHAPARWAQGELQVDGEWMTLDDAQLNAQASDLLAKYREHCESASDTRAGHEKLAQWCRGHGLPDEARYHWLKVLATDPQNKQALAAINSEWHDGQLVSPDEAKALRREQSLARRTDGKWQGRIKGWKRGVAQGGDEEQTALADLRATVDKSAIRAFEQMAGAAKEGSHEMTLAHAFVDTLADMPTYEATESLVRFALLAPDESLRTAATDQLTKRPKHEFMPLLLARLASLIETHYQISRSPTGLVTYTHDMFTKGREADEVAELSVTGSVTLQMINAGSGTPTAGNTAVAAARAVPRLQRASNGQVRQFMAAAANTERQVAQANAKRAATNDRVVTVLAAVTGKDYGNNLRDWWDYWTSHNEYEVSTFQPTQTYRESYAVTQQIDAYVPSQAPTPPPSNSPPPNSPPRRRCECFVAGTPVWTKTGMTPIEDIQEGDLVLSQDIETGELCYRPVTGTTLRDPSPIVAITAGEYEIEATLGHPFWVAGEGWRMAKELSEGDFLQTASGPVEVSQIEDQDDAEAYNLIVWGTNNYFVGEQGVLVHDNMPRRPDRVRAGTR